MKRRFPALVLMLSLLLCATVRAAGPQLEIRPPESPVKSGEEFTVAVDFTGNPGMMNIEFTLTFDKERMECEEVKLGGLLSQAGASAVNPAAKSGAILAAASAYLMTGDGPVATFRFLAKEDLSDFPLSIERITVSDQDRKKIDVGVVTIAPVSGGSDSADGGESADVGNSVSVRDNGSSADAGNTVKDSGNSPDKAPVDTGASENHSGSSGNSTGGNPSGSSGNGTGGNTSSSSGNSTGGNTSGSSGNTSGSSGNSTSGNSSGHSGDSGNSAAPDNGASAVDTSESVSDTGATPPSNPAPPESAPPRFTDTAGMWAESYINTAAERNLFQGYADGAFRPNNRLTRAQFMMVLWNLAGRPEPASEAPFTDMGGQIENFQKAVAWAYGQGYVNGTSAATFSPGEPLTRQAAMKILFGYHGGRRGAEVMLFDVYETTFVDSGRISAWAKDAMYWAVYQSILSGTSPTTLEPGGAVTRAQLAAIMVRYTDRFPS